jgi:hypothetical protein
MQRAWWIAIVASVVASSGCDECDGDDSYCDGNVLHLCVTRGYKGGSYWNVGDCGNQYCVEYEVDGEGAMCAAEPEPRPACASAETVNWMCAGAERLRCDHGFAIGIEDCGDPTLCVAEINACVLRPGVDETCQQLPMPVSGIAAGYCDGATAIRCTGSYVTEIFECASTSMECYELGAGEFPLCVASNTPDSRCGQPNAGVYNVCIGNESIRCANDRFVGSMDCSGICEDGFCH